jgi:hypothetical protein
MICDMSFLHILNLVAQFVMIYILVLIWKLPKIPTSHFRLLLHKSAMARSRITVRRVLVGLPTTVHTNIPKYTHVLVTIKRARNVIYPRLQERGWPSHCNRIRRPPERRFASRSPPRRRSIDSEEGDVPAGEPFVICFFFQVVVCTHFRPTGSLWVVCQSVLQPLRSSAISIHQLRTRAIESEQTISGRWSPLLLNQGGRVGLVV